MCLVLGLCLGTLANSSEPLLSSNIVQFNFKFAQGIFRISANSKIIILIGISSLVACDKAMYSASVVLSDISVYSLLAQAIGHPEYLITYPVLDLTEIGSSESSLEYAHETSAST